jgi:hypothetical protein
MHFEVKAPEPTTVPGLAVFSRRHNLLKNFTSDQVEAFESLRGLPFNEAILDELSEPSVSGFLVTVVMDEEDN